MYWMYSCELTQAYSKADYISEGSVALPLGRDRIFKDHLIANWLQSISMKKYWKLVHINAVVTKI